MNDRMQPNNPLHDEGEVDLLSHPALKAMSPRELADIPFPRVRRPGRSRAQQARAE